MFIFLWGVTLLIYRLGHYGVTSGFFLWFDHWFLILSGLSLIKKSTRFQLGFTCLILIVQTLWALDNFYFLLYRKPGLGMTSFLFQPGLTLFEFLLLQSHFILPPLLLLNLPKEELKRKISPYLLLFPLIIFLFSYFAPSENDLNCIHSSCSPINIPVPHWLYSTLFAVSASLLLYLLSELVRRFLNLTVLTTKWTAITWISIILGVLSIIWNTHRFLTLPHFECVSSETHEAKISCLYTTDSSDNFFRLHYSLFIKGKTRKECTPYLTMNSEKEEMESPMLLPPQEVNEFSILVPHPKESLKGLLTIECHDFSY